jgi:hypothetical protein
LPTAAKASNAAQLFRMIVIGRYQATPNYLELAEKLGAKAFAIPQSEWDAMSPDKRWALNREFLDEAMASGEQIILATPPEKVPVGSTLEMELDYLASFGYLPKLIADQWEVAR